jgi:hypothetical protein
MICANSCAKVAHFATIARDIARIPISPKRPNHRFHYCPAASRVKNRTLSFSAFEFPQNALSVRVGFHAQ